METGELSRRDMLRLAGVLALTAVGPVGLEELWGAPRILGPDQLPDDKRLGTLKDLNGYFPFEPPASPAAWETRRAELHRQLLVACGLWPMPPRPPIQAVVHGRVDRGEYTVDRVYFESFPGLLVTGSLYLPAGATGRLPAVLSPHGHWAQGRFHDHGVDTVRREISQGSEQFEKGGRHPLQARCVQLARMGCAVFLYDMQGYADGGSFSYELIHRFAKQRPELSSPDRWGMFSAQSEMRLLNALGLQTWNSIRALDWLISRDDIDASRIGVTGASGGGTQTFMLAALDERVAAAFPAVMVSTAMQGGCTCENASYLRVGTGNIEFAAMVAPRPIAMTGARDWTVEIETKGLPELKKHYAMLGAPDLVAAKFFDFPHNYNAPSRAMMYDFFNRSLKLNAKSLEERDYEPLSQAEATVFNAEHPAPKVDEASEVALLKAWDQQSNKQINALLPPDAAGLPAFRETIGGAWQVLIGRGLPGPGQIEYERLSETEQDGVLHYTAWLRFRKHGETLPSYFLFPKTWNGQVTLWVSGQGKAGLFGADGKVLPAIQRLTAKGTAVGAADLLYQGEFLKNEQPMELARIVDNPREFAGYTLGYNYPLFSQRVHDILSLIAFARHHEYEPKRIDLIGVDGGGVLAAAAAAIAGPALTRIAVDTAGYRFGQITNIRDVNLVPGAVKYGDVPFLLGLCAPVPLAIAGESVPAPTAQVYAATQSKVISVQSPNKSAVDALVDWTLMG